jgi:hypothetical protein
MAQLRLLLLSLYSHVIAIKWRNTNSFYMNPSAHQVQRPTTAAPVEGHSEMLPLNPSELVVALGQTGWGEESRTAFAQAWPPGSPNRRARGRSSTLFRPQTSWLAKA